MDDATLIERLFCAALLDEGTDVILRVTKRYCEYRDNPDKRPVFIDSHPQPTEQGK